MSNGKISAEGREVIFSLAERLTGSCQQGKFRREILVSNVERRMQERGLYDLDEYLQCAMSDPHESAQFISALTIHTTSWFREVPHFGKIERRLREQIAEHGTARIRVLCAACSTGEEVYSLALVLEKIRTELTGFEYQVMGVDIDPVSVSTAKRAVYSLEHFHGIPRRYRLLCLIGQKKMEGLFTLSQEIKQRCSFAVHDLRAPLPGDPQSFDIIICRNVLIYFTPEDVDKVVTSLLVGLSQEGSLYLGHSETIEPTKHGLRFCGNSSYVKRAVPKFDPVATGGLTRRVLVVDDSLTARRTLERLFERHGARPFLAASADEATEFLKTQTVDLITLDLHMPGTNGDTWLRAQRVAGMKIPVVIVTGAEPSEAMAVLGALESGAQDYLDKGLLNSDDAAKRMLAIAKPTSRHRGQVRTGSVHRGAAVPRRRPDVILLGASTGGTEVLSRMLQRMPINCPPVVVVQHISAQFSQPFAERLAKSSGLTLGSSVDGAPLEPGHLYVALGDYHIGIAGRKGRLILTRSDTLPLNRHRPSVDFLFCSGAEVSDIVVSAALMTGMGADGAKGLKALLDQGATTFAQDEESCVVFGMPKEAIALGGASFVGSPEEIRTQLDRQIATAVFDDAPSMAASLPR